MSDYKLTFKLKQHTPYIHFQHNHLGATLRASDLKPRIDKYLYNEHKIEKQKYQLTISAKLENDYPKEVAQGKEPYFGKHKLFRYNDIELIFNTYFNSAIVKQIKEILPKVFACENFGSFGSKGYGGFTDENQTQKDFEKEIKNKYKTVYYWETTNTSDSNIFFQIKYFYSLLKSGINIPGRNTASSTYYKSILMEYFLPDIRWEKRGIKKKFAFSSTYNRTRNIDQTDAAIPTGEDYKAIKPLLGYSKSQEWQSYRKTIGIDFPEGIDRINSPLFFKALKENNTARIYCMIKDTSLYVNKIYPNKKFEFSVDGNIEPFYTPASFSYTNFIHDAVNKINTTLIPSSAAEGLAQRVDNFIKLLTTTKIKTL